MFDSLRARFSKRPEAAAAQEPVRPPPGGYKEPFHAVVVGSGPAALETTLALRAHGGDLVEIQLVAGDASFAPSSLAADAAPDARAAAGFTLADFAAGRDAELTVDHLVRIDAGERRIFTERRRLVDYDALVLCLGSEPTLRDGHAVDGLPAHGSDGRIFTADDARAERTARDVAKLAGAKSAVEPAATGTGSSPRLVAYLASRSTEQTAAR